MVLKKDIIAGLTLLAVMILGALKGRHLPEIVPIILVILSLCILIFRFFIIKSATSFLYTGASWLGVIWIIGIALERVGAGILLMIPYGLLFLLTPAIMYVHWRVYRRFNPVVIRGLELEETNDRSHEKLQKIIIILKSPKGFREKLLEIIKLAVGRKASKEVEAVTFDLGTEVEFKNK